MSTPTPAPPTPGPAPNVEPVPGLFVGYVEVTVTTSAAGQNLVITVDGTDPTCELLLMQDGSVTSLMQVLTKTSELKAISCNKGVASEQATVKYDIEPGPVVKVSFILEGDVKASDLTADVLKAFKAAFALQIGGIAAARITSADIKDARRRLLTVDMSLGIVSNSDESAEKLAADIGKADLSGVANAAGLPGARVAGLVVSVETASGGTLAPTAAPATPESSSFPVLIVAALVGGVAGLSLMAAGGFYFSRMRNAKTLLALKEQQAQSDRITSLSPVDRVDADLVGANVSPSPAVFPADRPGATPINLESRYFLVAIVFAF
jgi:hypothetical protein